MENQNSQHTDKKKELTPEEMENLSDELKEKENTVNKGSSVVDTRIHQPSRNYGRTTGSMGPGHEPGTTPGIGE